MKTFILFLVGSLTVFMVSCQLGEGNKSNYEMPEFKISQEDVNKELSHEPIGEVYVQSVKIDFGLSEWMAERITKRYDGVQNLLDTIPTVGKLVAIYKEWRPSFQYLWSSLSSHPAYDSDYVLPKLEYALAQVCFQDDCNTQTRKAVLQMVVNKQKQIIEQEFTMSFSARKTGLFLMTVILAKEKDTAFLTSIKKDFELQKAMCLNVDDSRIDDEFCSFVRQFAVNFLSNQ